jgi:hypothetical protein
VKGTTTQRPRRCNSVSMVSNSWRISRLLLLFLLAFVPGIAHSQEGAVVGFTLDFPGSEPSHYVVSVSSERKSTYSSAGKAGQADDAFRLDFEVSPATCKRIFDLAARANYFDAGIDSKRKGIAFTGTKTLTYKSPQKTTSASYNYSPVVAVQELTTLFQSLSATLEFGHRLEYFHRYQKLALDDEMKRMEEMSKANSLQEIAAVIPILQAIADDPTVINPVRTRARRLIEQASSDKAGGSSK